LEAEWIPGLLNVDKRKRSLENVQGPYRESNLGLFFWLSVSIFTIVYSENHDGRGVAELLLNGTFSVVCPLPSLKPKIMTYAVTLDRTRGDTEATLTTCVINTCTFIIIIIIIIIIKAPVKKTKDRLVSAEMDHLQIIHIKIH
jgi:hypothetical protein